MTLLQALAEEAPKAADALLAFATGNSATREMVLDLAAGSARLTEEFPEAAVNSSTSGSEEFLTFSDPLDLQDVLDRGTLEQWQLFLHPDQRSLVERTFSGPARLRGISGSGKTVVALHRARRLAKEAMDKGEKVLFTTFDKGLAAAAGRLLDTPVRTGKGRYRSHPSASMVSRLSVVPRTWKPKVFAGDKQATSQ